MKKIIVGIVFLFTVTFAFATNDSEKATIFNTNETLVLTDYSELTEGALLLSNEPTYKIIVNISREGDAANSCTIEGKVTVTTESGDSVSIEFKITASTCKEAMRVQATLMEAFE